MCWGGRACCWWVLPGQSQGAPHLASGPVVWLQTLGPQLPWGYLHPLCLKQEKILEHMGFGSNLAGTPCTAHTDIHGDNFGGVNAITSRHKVYKLRAFRAGLEEGGWCGWRLVEEGPETRLWHLQNMCFMWLVFPSAKASVSLWPTSKCKIDLHFSHPPCFLRKLYFFFYIVFHI